MTLDLKLKLSYKQQKLINKHWGKQRAKEIAIGRKLIKMMKVKND